MVLKSRGGVEGLEKGGGEISGTRLRKRVVLRFKLKQILREAGQLGGRNRN